MNDYKKHSGYGQMPFPSGTEISTGVYYDHHDNSNISYHETGGVGMLQQPLDPFAPNFSSYYTPSSIFDVQSLMTQSNDHVTSHNGDCGTALLQSRLVASKHILASRNSQHPEIPSDVELECQESLNEDTMLSEPILPAMEGFPNVHQFDQLMHNYVNDLSVKKQDKALIHAKRARNIKIVLADPKDTAIESAQFRFWVKKMFKLQPQEKYTPDCKKMIYHEGKPVAIREKLFKILTLAHQRCQHGGRDKTSAQVRRFYSWVPKELISRFVKICPTCQSRRGGLQMTPNLEKLSRIEKRATTCFAGDKYSLSSLPKFSRNQGLTARLDCHDKGKADISASLPDMTNTFHVNGRSLSTLSVHQPLTPYDGVSLLHASRAICDAAASLPAGNAYNAACVGHSTHYDY